MTNAKEVLMLSALIIFAVFYCVFCCGCTQSTRQERESTVKEETRKGVESGQPTNLKIVTREVTQTEAKEQTGLDPEAVKQIVATTMQASLSGLTGDIRGVVDTVKASMSAPKPGADCGAILGAAGAALVPSSAYAYAKHREAKSMREKAFVYAERVPPPDSEAYYKPQPTGKKS